MLDAMPNDSTRRTIDERFDELSLRYLDGLLTAEEHQEFAACLRNDERCRDEFVTLCVQSSLLLEQADEEITYVPNWPQTGHQAPASIALASVNLTGDSRLIGFLKSLVSWISKNIPPRPADSPRRV